MIFRQTDQHGLVDLLENLKLSFVGHRTERKGLVVAWRCFTESIEEHLSLAHAGIESTLDRHSVVGIVLLVIGEDYQLSDIQKTAEIALAHTSMHAFAFCQHTLAVLWFLDLDMHQWQAVDKTSDIRAEVVLRGLVGALQFDSTTPVVILGMVKIDETAVGLVEQFVVKLATKVVVISNTHQFA